MQTTAFFNAVATSWRAARKRHRAERELAALSARDLGDMGITRLDVSRLFEPRLALEFQLRGTTVYIPPEAGFKSMPQREIIVRTLEPVA
jgi:uncharacterized protein YjiS (DUF1127 family)